MSQSVLPLVKHFKSEEVVYNSLGLESGDGELSHIVTDKTPSPIGAGFIKLSNSSFEWELLYDEILNIVSGELYIIENEVKTYGKTGDVFYLPKGSKVTYGSDTETTFFYAITPSNWRELKNL